MSPIIDKDDHLRCLAAVPAYHIYGFNTECQRQPRVGGTIILVPPTQHRQHSAAVNQHEPTLFPAVPTMIIGLNQHPDIGTSKIGSIKVSFRDRHRCRWRR